MDCLALGFRRFITVALIFNFFLNWHLHGYRALRALRQRALLVIKEASETLCQRRELLPLRGVRAGLVLLADVFLQGNLLARTLRKFIIWVIGSLVSTSIQEIPVSGCP